MRKHNILLIAPRHEPAAYWFSSQSPESRFPLTRDQAQYAWAQALERLGHQLRIYSYSDSWVDNANIRRIIFQMPNVLKSFLRRLPFLPRLLKSLAQKSWGQRYRTQHLLKEFTDTQPDLFFISGGPGLDVIPGSFWEELRALSKDSQWVLFSGMDPAHGVTASEIALLPHLMTVVTNDESHARHWIEKGAPKAFSLPISAIADDASHASQASTVTSDAHWKSRIAFVGALSPAAMYHDRLDFLRALADLGLGIWTPHSDVIKNDPALRACYRGTAHGADFMKAYQYADIGLNLHGQYMPSGANLRTFELPAAGCLQMVDHLMPGLFTPDQEIILCKNPREMREKAQYFLGHEEERKKIAKAAQIRLYRDHTYQKRFEALINHVEKLAR